MKALLIVTAFASAAFTEARADKLFFGEVPVQYIARGDEIGLDMHRFVHPPEAILKVENSDAVFDASAFTLRAKAT